MSATTDILNMDEKGRFVACDRCGEFVFDTSSARRFTLEQLMTAVVRHEDKHHGRVPRKPATRTGRSS
jgi:hypothetical protein